jgi:hypothetical protein
LPLLHIDAGLRSGCVQEPEQRNGMQVDRLAHLLLAPTPAARRTLIEEGLGSEIHVVGDLLFGDYRVALCIAKIVTDFLDRRAAFAGSTGRQPLSAPRSHPYPVGTRGSRPGPRARRLLPAASAAAMSPLAKMLLEREWWR